MASLSTLCPNCGHQISPSEILRNSTTEMQSPTTTVRTAAVVAVAYYDVFPYHRTAFSATPMNAATTPITLAVIRDWKRDAEPKLKTFLRVPVMVG